MFTVSPTSRRARFLVLLGVVNAAMSSALYVTVLPPLARELSIGEASAGLITSIGAVAFALAAPIWGVRADTWGRTRTILIGLSGYGLVSAAFAGFAWLGLSGALSGAALYIALLVARPAGGVLAAAIPSASQAYIADVTTRESRTAAMGLLGAAQGIGMVIGPALGAVFAMSGVLTPIWATAVAAGISAIAIAIFLPEPKRSAEEPVDVVPAAESTRPADELGDASQAVEPKSRGLVELLGRPSTRLPLASFLVTFATVGIIDGTLGFNLQDTLGLDTADTIAYGGAFLLTVGIALIVVQLGIVGMLKPPPSLALRGGLTGLIVALICYVFADTLPLFLGTAALFGLSAGLAISGGMASASLAVGPGEQGRMAGLMTMTQGAGFACGPFLGGLVYEWNPIVPPVACAALLVGVAAWAWIRPVSSMRPMIVEEEAA